EPSEPRMTLQPGCRFAVAPHFHLPIDWPRRLLVGTGVEQANGSFVPRGPWRPPTTDEMSHLVLGPAGPTFPEEPDPLVDLFRLPQPLRAGWWRLLDRAGGVGDGCLPGCDAFVGRLVEFLAFKGLPAPEGGRCNVLVSRPGQRSVRGGAQAG